MLEYLSRYWWTLAIRGAIAVVFGLAALIWPHITLRVLVWLFGFYAVVDGLLALAALLLVVAVAVTPTPQTAERTVSCSASRLV